MVQENKAKHGHLTLNISLTSAMAFQVYEIKHARIQYKQ